MVEEWSASVLHSARRIGIDQRPPHITICVRALLLHAFQIEEKGESRHPGALDAVGAGVKL